MSEEVNRTVCTVKNIVVMSQIYIKLQEVISYFLFHHNFTTYQISIFSVLLMLWCIHKYYISSNIMPIKRSWRGVTDPDNTEGAWLRQHSLWTEPAYRQCRLSNQTTSSCLHAEIHVRWWADVLEAVQSHFKMSVSENMEQILQASLWQVR